MQAAKNASASAKETAENIAASAKAGMDKTMATIQEKVEKAKAHDQSEKEAATLKKNERISQAKHNKQEARLQNAAEKERARLNAAHPHGRGGSECSALPEHATGESRVKVTSGTAKSGPMGMSTGTGTTATHDPLTGCTGETGYGSGGG